MGFPVEVSNLSFKYEQNLVLDGVSFDVQRGKFYSIIGPNGSGKTTLLRNMSKSLFPEKNKVFVSGKCIEDYGSKQFAKEVSYVPQYIANDFEFLVMDIVLMGRNPYLGRFQSESKEDIDIASRAMRATNVWHLRDKKISQISGGEKQRVIIARALTQNTDIMFLDEPISNLDILHQIEIMEIIKSLVKNKGITVISVLHDLNVASIYSDNIILIKQGKVFANGNPHQIITKKNIKDVYGIDVHVMNHPNLDRPQIVHLGVGAVG